MPTRSTKLASLIPAAMVNGIAFTVIPGYTYLVKSVLIANLGGAGDTISVWFVDAAGTRGYLFAAQVLAAASRVEWEGWVAANPGDQLVLFSNLGTSHFWVSGTKLPGVA